MNTKSVVKSKFFLILTLYFCYCLITFYSMNYTAKAEPTQTQTGNTPKSAESDTPSTTPSTTTKMQTNANERGPSLKSIKGFWILKERIHSLSKTIPPVLLIFGADGKGEIYGLGDEFFYSSFTYDPKSPALPIITKYFNLHPIPGHLFNNKLKFKHSIGTLKIQNSEKRQSQITSSTTSATTTAYANANAAANKNVRFSDEEWLFVRLDETKTKQWLQFFNDVNDIANKQQKSLSATSTSTSASTTATVAQKDDNYIPKQASPEQVEKAMSDGLHIGGKNIGVNVPICKRCHLMNKIGESYAKGKHFINGKLEATCSQCHHGVGFYHGFIEDTGIVGSMHGKSDAEINFTTFKEMLHLTENEIDRKIADKLEKDPNCCPDIVWERLMQRFKSYPKMTYNFLSEDGNKRNYEQFEQLLGPISLLAKARYLRRGSEECKTCHKIHEKEMDISKQSSFARKAHVQANGINANNHNIKNNKLDGKNNLNCIKCHKGVGHDAPTITETEGL